MARSRNIKPSFFSNNILAECSPLARILFTGLWTLSDREGRLEDIPKKIKALILPYDDCDCDDLLKQLSDRSFIIRYSISSQQYIQIINFTKHQQPHYKEVPSVIPPPIGWTDSGSTGGGVPENIRLKIISRDARCLDCGSKDDLTLDHIIPRSHGGSHEESNLQTLCRKCNSSKNNRLSTSTQHRPNNGPTKSLDDSLIPLTLNPLIDSLNPNTDTSKYAYHGSVIKLSKKDYDKFKSTYHAIPDFNSALSAADNFYAGDGGKNWFFRLGGWLDKEHQKYVSRKTPTSTGKQKMKHVVQL